MPKTKGTVASIDLGTTKICVCIGRLDGHDIEILGTGWQPSSGLRKGVVANLSETAKSVKACLEQAEREAENVVESAYVSVGGTYLRGVNTTGEVEVRGKGNCVFAEDISRAVAEADPKDIPEGYEILHKLTQGFALDGHGGIDEPIGMTGNHLAVKMHVVLNASAVIQNIANTINQANVVVNGVVMQQLAAAEAVLTQDEKELGTVLVDIGGGTTDISVYNRGSIWHSEVLPMGGALITKDLAIGLKAPLQDAEEIKIALGSVFPAEVPDEEIIEIREMGSDRQRVISRRLVCQIIEARSSEILKSIKNSLAKAKVRPKLISGVVLTGGGSLLHGLREQAQNTLGVEVRLGYPIHFRTKNEEILNPSYATALGLVRYARDIHQDPSEKPGWSGLKKIKTWLMGKI